MASPTPIAHVAYRGDGSDRPTTIPLPPARAPMVRGWRLRKQWRYVGIWSPSVLVCAAQVRVGPLAQEFWGVWERASGVLTEHSRLWSGRVHVEGDQVRVADRGTTIEVRLEESAGSAFEVVTPIGRAWTWTRKAVAHAHGTVTIGGRQIPIDGMAMIDDNDGYHPRLTHWWWSGGSGRLADGRGAVWSTIVGLNDSLPHIENTLWIEHRPQPTGLVTIARDLGSITFDDGHRLRFAQESERATMIDFFILRSAYRQPFGTFSGTLPGGLELAEGYGVMEDHRALW